MDCLRRGAHAALALPVLLLAASTPSAQAFRRQPARAPLADCNGNGVPDEVEVLGPADIETIRARMPAFEARLPALLPDLFLFTEGESGESIFDGGCNMYNGGNAISTNLRTPINYTGGAIRAATRPFGPNGRFFTAKLDGAFVLVATDIAIARFLVDGQYGTSLGTVEVARFPLSIAGTRYTVFLKRVFGAATPSVNHVMIVPGDGKGIGRSISQNPAREQDRLSGLGSIDRIYYLLVATKAGGIGTRASDEELLSVASAFLRTTLAPSAADCDGNGVPDECDLASGAGDCDGDGVLDACEPDCNGNGVPDDCDIASGTSADCNGDGVPDECPGTRPFAAYSGAFRPFDRSNGLSFQPFLPLPAGEVSFELFVNASISAGGDEVDLILDGQSYGELFDRGGGTTCAVDASDSYLLDRATFAMLALSGNVDVRVAPNMVSPCSGSSGRLLIEYDVPGGDCNGNSVPDECEVASGASADLDHSGVPDECEGQDVLVRVLPRRSDTGFDLLPSLPAPVADLGFGEPFVLEVWVRYAGAAAAGFSGAYVNLLYDEALIDVLDVEVRPPFSVLRSGEIDFPGFVDDLGGVDLSGACPGSVGWARLALVRCQALDACGTAGVTIVPSRLELAACGQGSVPSPDVSYGRASLRVAEPCVYDLDGDGVVDANDLGLFLACYGTSAGEPGFSPACDFDCDGTVGGADLALLTAAQGKSCAQLGSADYPACRRCPAPPPSALSTGARSYR